MDGFAGMATTTKPLLNGLKTPYQPMGLAPLNGLQALHKQEGQTPKEKKKPPHPQEQNPEGEANHEADHHVQQLCKHLLRNGLSQQQKKQLKTNPSYKLVFNAQQKQLQVWEATTLLLAIEEEQLSQVIQALKEPLPTGLLSSCKG